MHAYPVHTHHWFDRNRGPQMTQDESRQVLNILKGVYKEIMDLADKYRDAYIDDD